MATITTDVMMGSSQRTPARTWRLRRCRGPCSQHSAKARPGRAPSRWRFQVLRNGSRHSRSRHSLASKGAFTPASPLLAFQQTSPPKQQQQQQLQVKQPEGQLFSQPDQLFSQPDMTAFDRPGVLGGFERQMLLSQGILRRQCLQLVAAVDRHLAWAVTFLVPTAGMFLRLKLRARAWRTCGTSRA